MLTCGYHTRYRGGRRHQQSHGTGQASMPRIFISYRRDDSGVHAGRLFDHYVDTILKRWIDATGKEPIHAETGLSFSEVETQRATEILTVIASSTLEVPHHVNK